MYYIGLYGIFAVAIVGFIIAFIIYNRNINKDYSSITEPKISDVLEENSPETESASMEIGKTVEESKIENTNVVKNEVDESTNNTSKTTKVEEKKKEEIKQTPDPTFTKPIDGEVTKEFAKDNLIYSETLDEWVTHNGIDIKADKASIVKAAADGKVTGVKNDPRYGITVIIEHDNGYETRYSNLLTAEFINVGEKVVQGQTIGTVGNTAAFEVLDDSHLHFEILKNSEYLDPSLLIK